MTKLNYNQKDIQKRMKKIYDEEDERNIPSYYKNKLADDFRKTIRLDYDPNEKSYGESSFFIWRKGLIK